MLKLMFVIVPDWSTCRHCRRAHRGKMQRTRGKKQRKMK